ncbi:MAG: amino acid ABC transporter permease [Clostridia bacterium]|nr:amino acid ABC transporter permease [Clostridia bacterium]
MLFKDLGKIFSSDEFLNYYLVGFGNTLALTFAAALIGLVLGFTVALVKIAAEHNKWMKIPAFICNIYTTIFRGTPVALQLFLWCFVIFAIPGFKSYAAILAFGINSGAYISENIRAGISSIDKGQLEAGRAIGLSWTVTMVRVILPQAVKNIIPAIGNEIIALLKETAIISIVGATPGTLTFDLNAAANTVTFQTSYVAAYLVAAVMYLVIVYIFVIALKLIEKRLRKSEKR